MEHHQHHHRSGSRSGSPSRSSRSRSRSRSRRRSRSSLGAGDSAAAGAGVGTVSGSGAAAVTVVNMMNDPNPTPNSNSNPMTMATIAEQPSVGSFHFVTSDEPEPYVAPSLDSGFHNLNTNVTHEETIEATATTTGMEEGFVTQPPKLLVSKGLTGKISTLFRRDSSSLAHAGAGAATTTTTAPAATTSASPASSPAHKRQTSKSPGKNKRSKSSSRSSTATATANFAAAVQKQTNKLKKSKQNKQQKPPLSPSSFSKATAATSPPHLRSPRASQKTTTSAGGAIGVGSDPEEEEEEEEQTSASVMTPTHHRGGVGKRIFYSSNADDSDDSYESKVSSPGGPSQGGAFSGGYSQYGDDDDDLASPRIHRFRGFSTSIKSLFLDEALVCASMGCFGLLLSNRTEYLLAVRNQRRGALSPRNAERRHKLPSKVVAYGLVLTILLMFSTFLIWGFGTGHGLASGYYQGYDKYYDGDDASQYNSNSNNNKQSYYADDANSYNGNGNNNNNNYNNDDGGNNNYYNNNNNQYNNYNYNYNNQDDGAAGAANDDDGAANNGDDNQNNNNNDDNNYNDDGDDYYNRRRRVKVQQRQQQIPPTSTTMDSSVNYYYRYHQPRGIFKLRDVQENVWNPVWELVQSEWNREDLLQIDADPNNHNSSNYSSSGDNWMHHQRQTRQRQQREQVTYYDVVDDATSKAEYTQQQRDIGANIRTALLFAFLLFLGVLGRRRRMRTRFYLVRARAQEDHLYYASAKIGSVKSMTSNTTTSNSVYQPASPNALQEAAAAFEAHQDRENQYEGACSHTLCGCYPIDQLPDEDGAVPTTTEEVQVRDTGIFRRKRRPHHEDIVARGFNCCMASCCGVLCKCWFQCLSICALAQEAREIRLLLPTRYQRIDFITHQPFHEYHQNVTDLRLGWMGKTRRVHGILPHYHALSRLSRYIVATGTVAVIAIVVTLLFNPRAAFSWQDAVVLAATFVQSFLVLFIVHWIFHKSDLSLDAVIKLFAAGFLIAVPSAFFFEGLLVNIVLLGAWGVYSIFALALGDRFTTFTFTHWRLIWILGELFNAYVVAAITEELCKYYTFRAVEHPDLMFLTGLHREEQDDGAVVGGVVRYPFGSHQVSDHIRVEMMDTLSDADSCSQRSNRSNRSNRSASSSRRRRWSSRGLEDDLIEDGEKVDFRVEEPDVRTYRQKAMAITTGMISVAVGLACAENMLYVFVLGGALANDKGEDQHQGDVIEAWVVLFFRSIFPIHALAAAMQSINMIRKFVETSEHSGHRIGVGRIVLPAVILHGSFDAVLMGINVFVETAWDNYLEENDGKVGEDPPYNSLTLNLVAWISITGIMILGIIWYFRENRLQRKRLKDLEEKEKAKWAQGGGEPESEVELV